MAARNDITGDAIVSKKTDDSFRDGWDRIFGKKTKVTETEKEKENADEVRTETEGN